MIRVWSTLLVLGLTLLSAAPALAQDVVQVPEPGSLVLLSVGAAALVWGLRQRR